ncbi:heparan-alpha-glucosaminide N-acetyltransferase domain-containing protein [Streptomyces capitiformicae]|uniref:Transporter n=1 Tax=Streptomyces capitiformicae TaxID=2014920 RepID=A0A919L2N2_9ACTN|nr:heparan-alpha-glucosaminide N-acetyltransferase domain-containing protein [Streptomyces capitiformicae]GHH80576.1 transporter [Streptomyces capitiformicae]
MTQNAVDPATGKPAAVSPHTSGTPSPGASTGRLIGVDLARGLAVFGMYAAHVGPDPSEGGAVGFVMELSHGRASALFAFLAGFSIILITGRHAPKTGRAGRQAVAKVVIRALVLLVVGTGLTLTGTAVEVILAFYGLYFLLVLPLYRLGARPLAIIAGAAALVLPQILYVVHRALDADEPGGIWTWPADADGLLSLLFTGSYPALTWIPFVVAGMAVARLDPAATAVRLRLALTGAGLAVLGYGGSWLALHLVPGALAAVAESGGEDGGSAASAWWSDTWGYPSGDSPAELLVAAPHSETTLSIVGNSGVAVLVLIACLAAVDAFPRLHRLARPVITVGTMSLTAYVLHVVGIQALGIEELPGSPPHVLLGFLVAVTVFATLWSRFFRRGPLEWLLGKAAEPARLVR